MSRPTIIINDLDAERIDILLGLRVGDSIHWELPGGVATHLEVLELEYQPEAAGDYLL